MKSRIVSMLPGYLDEVMAIELECFKNPWSRDAFLDEIKHSHSDFSVIGPGVKSGLLDTVQGFVVSWRVPGEVHLLNLAVAPQWRRQGLGTALIEHTVGILSDQGGGLLVLEVRQSNHVAQKLYSAFGFKTVGRRPGYYQRDREDALVMVLGSE